MSFKEYLVEPSLDTLPVEDRQKDLIRQIADEYAASDSLAKAGVNTNNCVLINGITYQEVLYEAQAIANFLCKKLGLSSSEFTIAKYFTRDNIYDAYSAIVSNLGYTKNLINIVPDFSQTFRQTFENYPNYVPDFLTSYKDFCAYKNEKRITIFLSTDFYPHINRLFDTVLTCDAEDRRDGFNRTINYLNSALGKEVTKALDLDKLVHSKIEDLTVEEKDIRGTIDNLRHEEIPTLDSICKDVIKQNVLYDKPINLKTLEQCRINYITPRESQGF